MSGSCRLLFKAHYGNLASNVGAAILCFGNPASTVGSSILCYRNPLLCCEHHHVFDAVMVNLHMLSLLDKISPVHKFCTLKGTVGIGVGLSAYSLPSSGPFHCGPQSSVYKQLCSHTHMLRVLAPLTLTDDIELLGLVPAAVASRAGNGSWCKQQLLPRLALRNRGKWKIPQR